MTPDDLKVILSGALNLRDMTGRDASNLANRELDILKAQQAEAERKRKEGEEKMKVSYSTPYEKDGKKYRDKMDYTGAVVGREELGPVDKDYKYWQSPTGQIQAFKEGDSPPPGWTAVVTRNQELTPMQAINVDAGIAKMRTDLEAISAGKHKSYKPEDLPIFKSQIDFLNAQDPNNNYEIVEGTPWNWRSPLTSEVPPKLVVTPKVGGSAPADAMNELPPPAEGLGKGILRDTVTGKRYKSNGTEWIEVK